LGHSIIRYVSADETNQGRDKFSYIESGMSTANGKLSGGLSFNRNKREDLAFSNGESRTDGFNIDWQIRLSGIQRAGVRLWLKGQYHRQSGAGFGTVFSGTDRQAFVGVSIDYVR
jgi:hypothetical protein